MASCVIALIKFQNIFCWDWNFLRYNKWKKVTCTDFSRKSMKQILLASKRASEFIATQAPWRGPNETGFPYLVRTFCVACGSPTIVKSAPAPWTWQYLLCYSRRKKSFVLRISRYWRRILHLPSFSVVPFWTNIAIEFVCENIIERLFIYNVYTLHDRLHCKL